jgi:hypothetical protein
VNGLNHPLTSSLHEGESVIFALKRKKEPKTIALRQFATLQRILA